MDLNGKKYTYLSEDLQKLFRLGVIFGSIVPGALLMFFPTLGIKVMKRDKKDQYEESNSNEVQMLKQLARFAGFFFFSLGNIGYRLIDLPLELTASIRRVSLFILLDVYRLFWKLIILLLDNWIVTFMGWIIY